jgi:CheY-specific phosphatase CheX
MASMNTGTALHASQEQILRQIVAEACVDILAAGGLAAHEVAFDRPPVFGDHDIAGFIGFTGSVRGSLVIGASSALFLKTHPLNAKSLTVESSASLLDWAGEMANQTVGRIKRRFCERGVDFSASTPTAVIGRQMELRSPPRWGIVEQAFAAGDEILTVCLEIMVPPDGIIFKDSAEPLPCSLEGELILF